MFYLIFLLILIFIFFNIVEKFTNNIKILHLVLYSDDIYYNQMYDITSKYYSKFKNIKTVYYKFSNQTLLNNDILTIEGTDTFLPGILDKTIKAFDYFKDYDCDYIVRSNISTIINFNLLSNELNKKPIDYASGLVMYIDELYRDPHSGIINNRYSNTYYASGTNIILSKKLFNQILLKKNNIDYNIIDDVSIGVFIKQFFPNIKLYEFKNKFIFVDDNNINNNNEEIIFYRNRNNTRDIDVKNMSYIVNKILF